RRPRVTSWMIVTSPENFATTRRRRFTVQGVKRRHARLAARIAPGDGVCWYVTGAGRFAAVAAVASPGFEGTTPLWVSVGQPDAYPWRFRLSRARAVDPQRGPAASTLAPELRFTRKWPAAHWRLAFQGNLHEIADEDLGLIARAIHRSAKMES